jgi:large subunit ribosomal protein L4
MVDVHDLDGKVVGEVELDPAIFDVDPNEAVMHQVVTAQLAAARSGTANTKTRAEVRGGGAKPWRQKGTGRARHGSIRSPQWVGGGVVFGPKPRDYSERTPKRMRRLALRGALSNRARNDRIKVVDAWAFDAPSTKRALEVLGNLDVESRILVVIDNWDDDEVAVKSFRNLQSVHIVPGDQVSTYDVLRSDWIVFSRSGLVAAVGKAAAPARHSVRAPGSESASEDEEEA